MSQIRETGQEPFKACKFLVFSTEKHCDILTRLMRGAVALCLLTSLFIVVYSAFSGRSLWFRYQECVGASRNSGISRITHEAPSADMPEPTNISHIFFGLGGSVATWPNRRHFSEQWWRPNLTRGVVWLDAEPGPNVSWPETSPPYRVSEDWTRFKYSSSQAAVRIARIVLESFLLGSPDVRWFVMGDDDTVFFPDNLVSVLAKYDHSRMYYIGGCSESVEQNEMHSYEMAFGGGGFAVSYPLAARLAKTLDGCIDRYYTFYGSDQRVWACISELGVSLTRERGFHQIDIRGNPYGLLAAHPVAPLVSLHHLDYLDPLFPTQNRLDSLKSLINAHRVDPARIIQQSFCFDHNRNWSVSVSWGYTAQVYPSLVAAKDLERPLRTFRTWRSWSDGPFLFNTRPMDPDPCKLPVIYFLDKVIEVGRFKSLTTYKRLVPKTGKHCTGADYVLAQAVKRISVSAFKMDPEDWKQTPRRQCCDILDRSMKGGSLRVRIRSCKPWETVST